MGRIIDIEYDGLDEIREWAGDWPDGLTVSQWEEQESRRNHVLMQQYGMELDAYDKLIWTSDQFEPVYPKIMALIDSNLIPGFGDSVRIAIREIPSPRPGEMYCTKNGYKSFSEVRLSERLESLDCGCCRNDGFMGGWYYEVEDDDGSVSKCRGCWRGLFGDEDDGIPPVVADDFAIITQWNESGNPAEWKGCPEFDWD